MKFRVIWVMNCEDFSRSFSVYGGLEVASTPHSSRRAASERAAREVRGGGWAYVLRRVKGEWKEVEEHYGGRWPQASWPRYIV